MVNGDIEHEDNDLALQLLMSINNLVFNSY